VTGTRTTLTPAQWVQGARPRTLPAAVSPVAAGTGAAYAIEGGSWARALLALVVALALQVGVNYANDYSDGIRGTDAERVGPLRLVGSGLGTPRAVRLAAMLSFAVAAVVGLVLVVLSGTWWLLAVGTAAIGAAWYYTGGSKPYGYSGFGEVFVFVFFGPVAVLGTTYTQAGGVGPSAALCGVAVGFLACAILVANNLRDIHSDGPAGKHTLAVRLGAQRTRHLYAGLVVGAALVVLPVTFVYPLAALSLLAVPLAVPPLRAVATGAAGPALIPVLGATGRLQLVFSLLLGLGLALS